MISMTDNKWNKPKNKKRKSRTKIYWGLMNGKQVLIPAKSKSSASRILNKARNMPKRKL